ncbi:MAG: phospholipase/carboxylesterase [Sphingomonadales bacterium]|jgi:phospholipase/carboxylesterase|nr:phospholipase/carboxylesterase [Sphingomonadales bacterium]
MTLGSRHFLAAAASLLLVTASAEAGVEKAANASAGELSARVPASPAAPAGGAEPGLRTLRLQDALLYVPSGYRPDQAAPLLVMLHGAGGSADRSIALVRDHGERLGFLVLAPNSRAASWDAISSGRFGPDVSALDSALAEVFAAWNVDSRRVAIGEFSDGASYALSLGLINGGLFSDIFAFSPGFVVPGRERGRPRIFISHGLADRVLPIDGASRRIVPQLKQAGYEVTYEEFAGRHEMPDRIAHRFFGNLAAPPRR